MFFEPWLYLLGASLLDRFYGEYPSRLHPVVWMGQCIKAFENMFLGKSARVERIAGFFAALLLPLLFGGAVAYLLLRFHNPLITAVIAIYFLKASFALRALIEAGRSVLSNLSLDSVDSARDGLKSLCSRDASELNSEQLVEAAASSLAENLCDSVVASLFYFCIGGVPLAIAYRVVNTMDAMIGYKNHYKHLGFAAARLDDVLNWIPARMTALLLLVVGSMMGKPIRRGWKIAWRDHAKTPSPNGGWPMATLAGLLGVSFRKADVYVLGDAERVSDREVLQEAAKICERAGQLYLVLVMGGLAI